jgi:hypothetical protein
MGGGTHPSPGPGRPTARPRSPRPTRRRPRLADGGHEEAVAGLVDPGPVAHGLLDAQEVLPGPGVAAGDGGDALLERGDRRDRLDVGEPEPGPGELGANLIHPVEPELPAGVPLRGVRLVSLPDDLVEQEVPRAPEDLGK